MPVTNWNDIEEVPEETAEDDLLELLDGAGFRGTSWQPFSMGLTLVKIGAKIWNYASQVAVILKNAGFNRTAEGEALTQLSASHYAHTREAATNATRLTTLTCEAGEGPHDLDVGEVVVSDANGVTFRLIEGNDVTFPHTLSSGSSQQYLFEAEEAGTIGNVPDEDVDTIVTTLAGVTITADELDAEGVDEEADERLQERNETRWSTLNQLELIDEQVIYWALTASPSIAVARVNSSNPRGAGTLDVYIAGTEQTASIDDVDAAQEVLERKFFGSTTVLVKAAPERALSLSGTVYYVSSVGAAAARLAVEEAMQEYVNTVPLGGFDYSPGLSDAIPLEDIEETIKSATVSGVRCVKALDLGALDNVDADGNPRVGNFRKVVRGNWDALTFTAVTGRDG